VLRLNMLYSLVFVGLMGWVLGLATQKNRRCGELLPLGAAVRFRRPRQRDYRPSAMRKYGASATITSALGHSRVAVCAKTVAPQRGSRRVEQAKKSAPSDVPVPAFPRLTPTPYRPLQGDSPSRFCPDCGDQAIACGCNFPVIPVSVNHAKYP
jgi:hypothetical protein